MSRFSLAIERIWCPRCDTKPGERCRRPDGTTLISCHNERLQALRAQEEHDKKVISQRQNETADRLIEKGREVSDRNKRFWDLMERELPPWKEKQITIRIEGPQAVGKTTTAQLLQKVLRDLGAKVLLLPPWPDNLVGVSAKKQREIDLREADFIIVDTE